MHIHTYVHAFQQMCMHIHFFTHAFWCTFECIHKLCVRVASMLQVWNMNMWKEAYASHANVYRACAKCEKRYTCYKISRQLTKTKLKEILINLKHIQCESDVEWMQGENKTLVIYLIQFISIMHISHLPLACFTGIYRLYWSNSRRRQASLDLGRLLWARLLLEREKILENESCWTLY